MLNRFEQSEIFCKMFDFNTHAAKNYSVSWTSFFSEVVSSFDHVYFVFVIQKFNQTIDV